MAFRPLPESLERAFSEIEKPTARYADSTAETPRRCAKMAQERLLLADNQRGDNRFIVDIYLLLSISTTVACLITLHSGL
jgi:hypothetical protein